MQRPSSVAFVLPMLCSAEWLLSDPHRQDLTAWSRAERAGNRFADLATLSVFRRKVGSMTGAGGGEIPLA